MKQKYFELETSILSCVLQKPELMKKITIEDKYFMNYKKLWVFMKSFYNKFGNLDIVMMCTIAKPQYKFMMYIKDLIEIEPVPERIEEYQKLLIELCEEEKKNKFIIDKIYNLANDLLVRKVDVSEFRNKVDKIYNNADEIFKK